MLGIMEKELKYENIPWGYSVCFNGDCALCETCLHYLAGRLQPENRCSGNAIYPMAWKSGTCKSYREKRLVKKAWGFSHLYNNVPYRERAEARQCVRCYFSSGNGPYYRYHHGENMLTPKQQADIMQILAKFGPTEGLTFDHYVTDFDFF